jgi:SAM-dependent methyltransferase
MSFFGSLHSRLIFARRTRILAHHLSQLIPVGSHVVDVGSGDGLIDRIIMDDNRVSIEGLDTLIRPTTHIPVRRFDGLKLPCPDKSADIVMFVDVLHHTKKPGSLLAEAARVGRWVLIKDHLRKGLFANTTLKLMDWVGNAHHGVVLPYNYLSESEWDELFRKSGLTVARMNTSLGLYPPPLSWIFGRQLHFIALCQS